jgi:hypothetical protein
LSRPLDAVDFGVVAVAGVGPSWAGSTYSSIRRPIRQASNQSNRCECITRTPLLGPFAGTSASALQARDEGGQAHNPPQQTAPLFDHDAIDHFVMAITSANVLVRYAVFAGIPPRERENCHDGYDRVCPRRGCTRIAWINHGANEPRDCRTKRAPSPTAGVFRARWRPRRFAPGHHLN